MPYYSYVLRSLKTGILYKGSTEDIERRLQSHNSGLVNFTSKHLPWEMVLFEEFETRSNEHYSTLSVKQKSPMSEAIVLIHCTSVQKDIKSCRDHEKKMHREVLLLFYPSSNTNRFFGHPRKKFQD